MSLPTSEERVLIGIEQILQARDPRLKSLFATFTRLTRHEAMPAREQIPRRGWRRPSIIVLATLMLIIGIIAVATFSGVSRTCVPARPVPGAASSADNACAAGTVSRPNAR